MRLSDQQISSIKEAVADNIAGYSIMLLGENKTTIIEKANYLEKLGIASGEDLIEICDLRNEVAHEYVEEELIELYRDVLELSGKLVEIIKATKKYSEENIK